MNAQHKQDAAYLTNEVLKSAKVYGTRKWQLYVALSFVMAASAVYIAATQARTPAVIVLIAVFALLSQGMAWGAIAYANESQKWQKESVARQLAGEVVSLRASLRSPRER